jgi:hypothetical protein
MTNLIQTSRPAPLTRRWNRRWLTVIAAMATATALWGIAESLLGIDLVVRRGGDQLHIDSLAVTLTSLVVGLIGWGSLTLLERLTPRGRTIWRSIAAVVLLVSFTGPLSAVTAAAGVVLLLMHLTVGAILLAGLPRQPYRGPGQVA